MARNTTLMASLAAVIIAGGVGFAAPTFAQSDAIFDGSKARVNLSNKLLMLTQVVASASCRIDAGISPDLALDELADARTQFNVILNGLEQGGPALGIPSAERSAVVLKSIASVREAWVPVDTAAQTLVSGDTDSGAAMAIAKSNLGLLESAQILASDISGKYSNPHELTQADAMALHIAGRQRMLGQRMAKEVCGIATGTAVLGTPSDLDTSLEMYNVSLNALRDGMEDAGVNPPPNDTIRAELEAVGTVWTETAPVLEALSEGDAASSDNVEAIADLSTKLMKDMGNIVTLYMLATPGQEDVYRVPLLAYAEAELSQWTENAELIAAIRAQNATHAGISQGDIDQLDLDWRAQRKADAQPLIAELLGRPSSSWLRDKQANTAQFVTEVFAMDNRGLNVAQSVETSDYWQGDEAKWQETFGNGSGEIHISEVEFDDSTGSYQSQVSLPIRDPDTNELIGAITFGVNVQSLL